MEMIMRASVKMTMIVWLTAVMAVTVGHPVGATTISEARRICGEHTGCYVNECTPNYCDFCNYKNGQCVRCPRYDGGDCWVKQRRRVPTGYKKFTPENVLRGP